MILLKLNKLNLVFNDMRIIRDLDLVVEKQEIVGLIGATQSGKTVLFDLISGFYKPSAGKIYFDGENITKFSVEKKSRLGIARTFQNGSIFSDLSVADNVKIGFHSFILSLYAPCGVCRLKLRHMTEETVFVFQKFFRSAFLRYFAVF